MTGRVYCPERLLGGAEEDLDGGFAHGGWSHPYFDPETMGPAISDVMARSTALLYGRRTWQTMAAAWPDRAGDPYTDSMNGIQKYVASRILTQADLTWENSTLLPSDDAIGAIRELRATEEGALQIWGSASLAAQLIEADLVDEYVQLLEPVLLGGAGVGRGRQLGRLAGGVAQVHRHRSRRGDTASVEDRRTSCAGEGDLDRQRQVLGLDERVEGEAGREVAPTGGEALPDDRATTRHRGRLLRQADRGPGGATLAYGVVARARQLEPLVGHHGPDAPVCAEAYAHDLGIAHRTRYVGPQKPVRSTAHSGDQAGLLYPRHLGCRQLDRAPRRGYGERAHQEGDRQREYTPRLGRGTVWRGSRRSDQGSPGAPAGVGHADRRTSTCTQPQRRPEQQGARTVDLDAIRADLEQIVRESDATIAVAEADEAEEAESPIDPDHNPEDIASETSEADREEALVEMAVVRKADAESALSRLDNGVYGVCVDCGEKITEARLEYRPEAARCLACQEKFEDAQG